MNNNSWKSLNNLFTANENAPIGLIGIPMSEKSVTPGRCDLAPDVFRKTLSRLSVFDLNKKENLCTEIFDCHNLDVKLQTPSSAFTTIKNKIKQLSINHQLTICIGGNNSITYPIVSAFLQHHKVGLITFDAHFDLRDLDLGMINGNPINCLLHDGMQGKDIYQIGLQSFANSQKMFEIAQNNNINTYTSDDVKRLSMTELLNQIIFDMEQKYDYIIVDFDIDVICRSLFSAASGARPGGISLDDFFTAAFQIGKSKKVKIIDLTEFDPSLSLNDHEALVTARWFAEILSGFQSRK